MYNSYYNIFLYYFYNPNMNLYCMEPNDFGVHEFVFFFLNFLTMV